jgi:hypothetical protein
MAIIHDIRKYLPSFNDSLFFDNNIWVLLFCPIANIDKKKQALYSNFLKLVHQRKSAVFVNSLVLSEFSNYWLQTEFKKWKKTNPLGTDYKRHFIPTEVFKKSVEDVRVALKGIMKIALQGNDDFNALQIDNILSEFGNCDFNDSYYLEMARSKKWKIVTDDADLFKNNRLNVDVITGNLN